MSESCALADRVCEPCRGDIPPMDDETAATMLSELGGGWVINKSGHLERMFAFDNFVQAMEFANRVGDLAEEAGHHARRTQTLVALPNTTLRTVLRQLMVEGYCEACPCPHRKFAGRLWHRRDRPQSGLAASGCAD